MRNIHTVVVLAAFTAAGCSGGGESSIDPRGEYDVRGTWSVGGPLANGRTPGDAAADLLVDTAVPLWGVPSFAEDGARDAIADAIAEPVSAAVDARLAPELQSGSPFLTALEATLANVQVRSRLTLEDGLLP